jgi:hypothetical protein
VIPDRCESCGAEDDLCFGEVEGSGDDVLLCGEHCYHGDCDRAELEARERLSLALERARRAREGGP